MSDLMRLVSERLSGEAVDKIASQVGADRGQTERGIAAALPALVSAVSRKGSDEGSARELERSLDEDRDRSLFEKASAFVGGGVLQGELSSLLGGGAQGGSSQGLLDSLLGNKQHPVAEGVHKASGLDVEQSTRLLRMLAPLVMGGLAKMKRDMGLDLGGLRNLLNDEGREIDAGVQGRGGQSGGMRALLDRDDDGAIADDVSKLTGLFDRMREAR